MSNTEESTYSWGKHHVTQKKESVPQGFSFWACSHPFLDLKWVFDWGSSKSWIQIHTNPICIWKKKSHHPLLDCGSLLRHREVEVCERVNTPSPYRCVLSMCTHQIVWFLYIYIFWKKHEFHLKFIHFNSPRFPWWALSFFPSYAFWWKGVECGWSPSWRYSRRGFTLGFCLHPTSPATPPAPLFSWEASIRGDIGCGLWRQLVSEKLVCGINQGQVLPRIDPWGPNSLEATIQHHLGCWPQW